MATMKAAVIHEAGGPEVLKIESLPIPTPQSGEVLIRVKAFGLNRSELFTRQGHSPDVTFPRVLGIEAVGLVEKRRETSFARAISSRPRWAAWGGSSTAATPNIPACPRRRCRSSRPNSPGKRSAPSRRCCKRLGARCSSRSSRKGRASADSRRHDLGWAGGRGDR